MFLGKAHKGRPKKKAKKDATRYLDKVKLQEVLDANFNKNCSRHLTKKEWREVARNYFGMKFPSLQKTTQLEDFYKKLRKGNAKKDSDVDFGNENSFEEQNVITTEGDTEKQTKGQDKNIAEFKYKGIDK